MSDKQKQTMEKLAENIQNWNAEQRGYLFGYMECMAQMQGQIQTNKQEEEKKGE